MRFPALVACLCALVASSLAVIPGTASARTSSRAGSLSRSAVPASSAWKDDVIDPGAIVYPKAVMVIGASSSVSDPSGLQAAGGAVTTIHATGQGVPRLVIDLGVNTGGYVEVGITKTDGTSVRLGYSELRQFLTPHGDTPAGSLGVSDDPDGRTDVIATHAGEAYRSQGIRGGERYIALQPEAAGTVSIDYVRVRVTHLQAPVSAYAGHFYSSDRLLDRVWYAGAYTFAMDAFRDLRPGFGFSTTVVTDGAKRDRLLWTGDMAIENLLSDYSLRAGPGVIKSSLHAFSCLEMPDGHLAPTTEIATRCPTTPPPAGTPFPPFAGGLGARLVLPEYTAWWIIGVHDYYVYTGDAGFARLMMPVVRSGLAYFRAHMTDGLFVTPATAINWHPFDTATGADAHTNATLFRALGDAAELERRVGLGQAAARAYDARAASLRRAMLAQLWDRTAGAFVINAGDPRRDHTQDAQVEAVLDGVTNRSQSSQALRFITTHLERRFGVANGQYDDDPYMSNYVSPYISSTELLARLEQGDTSGALGLIRRTWGQMLNAGPGTLWEKVAFSGLPANYAAFQAPTPFFSASGAGFTSLAHGWSGGPVPALSGYVLGIRPTAPGYRSWIVAPQPGDLSFAQGQAPTPLGPIVSRWQRGRGKSFFRLTVIAPRQTTGVIEVPLLGRSRAIAMDGRTVWDGRHARGGANARAVSGAVAFAAIRGEHTFAWAVSAGLASASTGSSGQRAHWRVGWTTAMDDLTAPSLWSAHPTAPGTSTPVGVTYRFIVRPVVSGSALRLRFSNSRDSFLAPLSGTQPVSFGAVRVGVRAGQSGARVIGATNTVLTFKGRRAVTIQAGRAIVSDPVALPVSASKDLAVSVYVPSPVEPPLHPQTYVTQYLTRAGAGNQTGAYSGAAFTDVQEPIFWLDAVEILTQAPRAVVAIGDSITDGDQGPHYTDDFGMNRYPTYPDFLAERVASAKRLPQTAVVNEGVNGDSIAGLGGQTVGLERRLAHDVLGLPGVTDAVLEIGTNDITLGMSGTQIIEGLKQIVGPLRRHGIRVIGATLVPRGGYAIQTSAMDAARAQVNHFIRTSRIFDGVLDIGKAVGQPGNDNVYQRRYDSGDHLHPNTAGYKAIARTLNLGSLR